MAGTSGLAVALAGGGTGGHVVPGIRLLEHLRERGQPPADVLWFGAGRPIEDRVLAGVGEVLGEVPLERVALLLEPKAGGAPSLARLLRRSMPEVLRARSALKRHRSRVLLGLGGYTSLPAVLAARSLGLPVGLLEINAVAGKATRLLAPLARRVYHAWPGTLPAKPGRRHVWIGPPLAPQFRTGRPSAAESRDARAALGLQPDLPLLLVLGGSQGAEGLNRFCRDWAPKILARGVQILHQVGPGRTGEACTPFSGYHGVEYLDDVARALAAATVVLCRGGASTLAEVAARACPAVVVPYPHHRDRHQERNAQALGQGVRILDQKELDGAFLEELVSLCGPDGSAEREEMAASLVASVPLDGGERLVADLHALVAPR